MNKYVAITRPDHWFKNVFMLPGVFIAAVLTNSSPEVFLTRLLLGVISVCLVASANYVINEWLDAEFDRFHPVKRNRAAVVSRLKGSVVFAEYLLLLSVGLAIGWVVSRYFFYVAILLGIMGIIYNVPPFRTKDRIYLDVLSESVNNPIRLLMGWFVVISEPLPPSSLLFGYWMGGAFLMGVKRYSEFRFIGDKTIAGKYRRSFCFYTDESLLISSFFYALCSTFYLGVFLIKYRIELLFSLPFIAYLFAWYLIIGMKPDSAAQHPEHLYTEKGFIIYLVFVTILMTSLMLFDIPILKWFLENAFIKQ